MAVSSGFKRLGLKPSVAEVTKLKEQFTTLWNKKIGTTCPLQCGMKLQPRNTSFCHNVALATGGRHCLANVSLCCSRCNRSQHTLSRSEYLKLRKAVISVLGEDKWLKIRSWLAGSRW